MGSLRFPSPIHCRFVHIPTYQKPYMPYTDRQPLYREIESLRGRPVLAYVTSLRANASGQMAMDVIPEIIRRMEEIEPVNDQGIDLLVVSNGGDPIVAWRIATLLRERYGSYHLLAPYTAYSAATLLALGADSIVMHPYANLGPVDPQISVHKTGADGGIQQKQFPYSDLAHYLSFVRDNVGITDQRELLRAFELLCSDVTATEVGAAKRSSQLMLALGEKMLSLRKESDRAEARTIAEMLNKSYYHHGYSLGRQEARELRLPVKDESPELNNLMWRVWQSHSDEMECETPFDPVSALYSHPEAASALDMAMTVSIPAGLPPQIQQQAYAQVLQQVSVRSVVSVPLEVLFASVESSHGHSAFRQKIDLRGVRMPDMSVSIKITARSQKWEESAS